MDLKLIGDNIRKFRELKNITREVIAAEMEMSVSGYSRVERGEVDLTLTRLEKIADILEVDVSKVLNFDATQIFNISNSGTIQDNASLQQGITNKYNDEIKDKYIRNLEEQIERLKNGKKN